MDRQTDVDGLSLIDVSAEDDSLLSSPALKLHNDADRTLDFHSSPATTVRIQQSALASTCHRISPSESTEGSRANEKHSALHDGLNCGANKQINDTTLAVDGEQPQLCKEAVQSKRKRRAGQCNLRKSLAWDKAFFTSEGVLNPEELSLINKTFKKSNETTLPVIEEDESVRSSFGSNCSLREDDSTLQCLEEKLFAELQTSKPKVDNKADKIHNAAAHETFPAQPLGLSQFNAKHLFTEKRHIAMKVVETPLHKKVALGPQASFTSKRSSAKATEELQRASQSNDAYGKNCAAAPPVVTKNLSKGHKRMKYTHGNAVPANFTRPSSHRNSPAKIKENFAVTSKSAPSPNSSASDNLSSEKCPASSSYTPGKLRKALFEMPKEVAPGTADSYRNGNLLTTSCAQFFHGIPTFNSSMISATLTGSSSSFLTHTSCEKFAPTTGARTSADSTVSQFGKRNQEIGNPMAVHLPTKDDSINIAGNSMIFSAKNPPGNSSNALPVTFTAKPSGLRVPTKDDTISIASNSMIFSAKAPPSKTSNALPVTFAAKPSGLRIPTEDDTKSMIFSAKDPSSKTSNALPVPFAAKPSGLRMPSPKLGFFDSTKVIRAPFSSALPRRSAGNRVPPKPMPRGPSSINQGNRLKPPGVPRAIPSSVSVSNFSFPNYNVILPSTTPVTSNSMSDTALKSSITSIPAPPFLPQVKSDPEASGLVLLAQKKFGAFKAQQSSSVQRSDQKQFHSDSCNAVKTVIAEDIEVKTNLQSNFCQVSQYNCATMVDGNHTQLRFSQVGSSLQDIPQGGSEAISVSTIRTETSLDTEPGKISNVSVVSDILVNPHIPKAEESKTQLGFLQGKSSLPDIPQVGSEAIIATATDTETSPATEAGEISSMNVVSDIQTNPHIPKGNYGKMAEESQTWLSFMQGKSTSQDLCQTGPQPIWTDRNGANTSPTTEIGEALNANSDNDPQPGHCHGMAVLSDAKTNHMSEPLQSKQLPPLPCSKTAEVSEKSQLETCPDLIQIEEQDGISNGDSEGTMRDDKVKNRVSDLGSSLQQENKMKLTSWPVTLEHFPSPRHNSDLCSSLQESEMEPGSWPVRSGHLPSPGQNVSVHIEKQDGDSHQVSQTSISIHDEDLHDNIRNGNPNLVCRLQLENEIEPASQLVIFEQSLPTRGGETKQVTEEFLFSEASSLEKGLDLRQYKVHDRACTKVCQGSMNIQTGYSCDRVQSILSDVTTCLESKTGIKFNPEEHDCPVNALSSSNNNQDSTTDTLIISSLLSGCPSREAAPSVIEHISEVKDDSSLCNVNLSHSSATLEEKMKSELKCAGKEVKVNGRSPLSANYRLLNSASQDISQKHVKGRRRSVAGLEKLTSLPMSFSVSDDAEEKENSSPEGQDGVGMLEAQGADGHSHVSSGRKSKGNLSVQVQKNTNHLDASPFSEEWIAAIQAVGEEWLQMKRGPVQNSPPNKIVPQPGPWSPVRRHNQELGPFDCTKYTNAPESSDVCEGE